MVRDIPFLWWFLLVIFGLFLLHWRSELPCQDKLPEFHCTPILGCVRVLWLVFHPLGLRLGKALCGSNSVNMIDVGFIDRVRGRIGIHDVLKGGVIKGDGFTGFSVVQIRVCRGLGGGGGGLDHLWECQWVAARGKVLCHGY